MEKQNRIYYLDILRAIACLFVVMIHTSGEYVVKNIGSVSFWLGDLLDGLSIIAVPLFIMISGALMLDRDYRFTSQKLKQHVVKMIVFFVFWSLFYCFVNVAKQLVITHEALDIRNTLISLVKGHYHLWFVYLIIGLYLIVPLLRLWVNDENKKYVAYFIRLSIVFTFLIPQIIRIAGYYSVSFDFLNQILEQYLQIKYVGGFTAYFLLGWYLRHYEIEHKKALYLLGAAGYLVSVAGTYILSITTGEAIQIYENLSMNVLLQSVAVFVFVKDRFENRQKTSKLICSISKYSLGIYAIHLLFVSIMIKLLENMYLDYFAFICIPVVFVVSFVGAYLSAFILSKIPFFKKVVS